MKTKVYKSNWWRMKQLILMSAFLLMATAGFTQENLSISMIGDSDVKPGEDITYTITYSNTGDQIAQNVGITLQLPTTEGYYTFNEASPGGLYDKSTHTITWDKEFIRHLELMGAGPYVIQVKIRAGVLGTQYNYFATGYYMPSDGITEFTSTVSIYSDVTTVPETSSVTTRVDEISATEVTDVNGIIKSATGSLTYHLVKVENKGNIYDRFNLFIDSDNLQGYDCDDNGTDKDFQKLNGTIYDLNNNIVTNTEWMAPGEAKYYFVRKESPAGTNPSSGSGDKWNCMDIIAKSRVSGNQDDGMTRTLIVGNVSYPLISMTKIATPDPVERGGVLTYSVYIFNSNNKADGENLVLTDLLPLGTSYIEGSSTYKVGTQAAEPILPTLDYSQPRTEARWELGDLGYGPFEAKTITFQVRVDEDGPCTGELINDATLRYDGYDPIYATVTSGIVSHPDLVITKEAVNGQVDAEPGDQVTYILTYSNQGTCPVENVKIIDTFDNGKMSYVSNTGNGIAEGNNILFELSAIDPGSGGTLYPGDKKSFEVTLEVRSIANFPQAGTYLLNNVATIDGDDTGTTEIDEFNNTSSWAVAVKILPDLKVEKSVSPALQPGVESTYTLTVTNTGDKSASNAVVKDFMPADLIVGTISDDGAYSSGTITWPPIDTFAAGDKKTYTVVVTPQCSALGSITNEAEVWSDTPDKNDLDNTVELGSLVEDNSAPMVALENGSATVECLSEASAPAIVPEATDNCDGVILGVLEDIVDSPHPLTCEGTRVYTYSYTDAAANVSYWTYTYTIDVLDFVANMPVNGASGIACASEAVQPTPPEVNDNCGNPINTTGPVMGGTYVDCEGTITYTWNYADCAGNNHDWVYTYTIEAEDFTMPADDGSTVACVADASEPTPPTVNDNCGNPITPTGPVVGGSYVDCEGTITYTWNYADCEGNNHDWVYTYTIEAEDFTMPANTTETVACVDSVDVPTAPVVNDACGNEIIPVAGPTPSTPACSGEMVYSWLYEDCAGHSHVWTHTITISAPVVSMPPNIVKIVTAPELAAAGEPTPPKVTDNCGRELTHGAGTQTGDSDCYGAKIWTYTYTDCSGKTYKWTYTYTVQEPVVDLPLVGQDTTVINCIAEAVKPTPPVVTDSNDRVLDVSDGVRSADPACEGNITWTYTYLDCVGNAYDWVYTYAVDYTIAPTEVGGPAPTSSTVECETDAVAPMLPVVQDACGNVLSAPVPVMSGTYTDCEGTIIYTYTYEDCSGLEFEWVYTYTIDHTTAPTEVGVPVETASTVECEADAVAPTLPVVEDVCGNVLPAPVPVMSGTYTDCEGTVIYTYTYEDCSGLEFLWVYTYAVDHTTAPAEAGGPVATSSTVECESDAVAPTLPVVEDVCGNVLPAPAPVVSGTYTDCEGTIIYTYTYVDCSGLEFEWNYTYTIDIPDFAGNMPLASGSKVDCPADATAPHENALITMPSVLDYCGNDISSTYVLTTTPAPVDCEGEMLYAYTYTDCAGNENIWEYTYTIDIPAPVVPDDGGSTVACISDVAEPLPPVVSGACGGTTSAELVGFVDVVDPITQNGTRTYTFKYVDCAANEALWSYVYTIEDIESPNITCPENFSRPADPGVCYLADENVYLGSPITTDNCSVTSVTNDAPSQFPVGVTEVSWTVKDLAGNTNTCIQEVTVYDDEAPVITAGLDITQAADADECGAIVTITAATATDNCSVGAVTGTRDDGLALTDAYPVGTTTITWTVTDSNGNAADPVTQDVTVTDDEAPVILAEADIEQPTDSGACSATITIVDATAIDNCSVGAVTGMRSDGLALTDTYPVGVTTITWTVSDANGNAADPVTQDITITDDEAPVITAEADIEQPTDAGACGATITIVDATVTDNCSVGAVTGTRSDGLALTDAYPMGTTTITWTVSDVNGNAAEPVSQDVTVTDDEDPVVICAVTEDPVVEANESCVYLHSGTGWDATATDNCGVTSLTYTLTGATTGSGDTSLDGVEFGLGETTVTWTAINGTGNEITCSFTVAVNDVSAPTFTCNDFTVTLDENNQYTITPEDLELIATDIQGGCTEEETDITISMDIEEFTCETLGEQTVTVTVTDGSGNFTTCETTITVVDSVDPTITCAGDVEASVLSDESCFGFVTVPAPTASDNCGIASLTNDFNGSDDASGDYPVGETVVTWTVTDNDDNTATCEQRVVVISAPLALDDEASLEENEDVQIYVLDNDLDCDENLDNTSLTITSQPAEGTATINADGSITYKPNIAYYGSDQLTYQICDEDGQCDEAVVSITITPNEELLIPNGFSPNGDGINDYFRVRGIQKYPNAQIEIYNRWGAKVYKRDRYGDIGMYGNPGAWWDGRPNVNGTSNSEILTEGTYFIILILDGSNVHKGTLYINR